MRNANIPVQQFLVERTDSEWIQANTDQGFYVLFGLDSEASEQVDNLVAVLAHDVQDREAVVYIDVRFGNYVFIQD